MKGISFIILSFNSEQTIAQTIAAALKVSSDVHIVDSYSNDRTLKIIQDFPVKFYQREFANYSEQRNWAICNLSLAHDWQFHLDADEILSEGLIEELNSLKRNLPQDVNGFLVSRLLQFLGRPIRYGGMFPNWHLRLFKSELGRCEARLYDQHFIVQGSVQKLKGHIVDDVRMSLTEWTARHNKWAEMEAAEIISGRILHEIVPNLSGSPIERKRYLKDAYYKLPLFLRPVALFFYRYFIRLGFLDGREGLIFFTLQTFWFRFLVDAKIFEKRYLEQS